MPNTVVKTSLIEGEAIKTVIHKHTALGIHRTIDRRGRLVLGSASVDGMMGGCLQSDRMVKRYVNDVHALCKTTCL